MKSVLKKLNALILSMALLLCIAMPAAALTEDDAEYDGWIVYTAPEGEDFSPDHYTVVDSLFGTMSAAPEGEHVVRVEKNYCLSLQGVPDYTSGAWEHVFMETDAAWNHTDEAGDYDLRGDGVTVVLIDSGVSQHEDLPLSRLVYGPADYVCPADGNTYNFSGGADGWRYWHGTAVAGMIAAQLNGRNTDGVAPDVNLVSLCVTNESGGVIGGAAALAAAVRCAVDVYEPDVINISIGGEVSSPVTALEAACDYADAAGVIVVASAGNRTKGSSASSSHEMVPACYDSVVSVSACKQDGSGGAVFDGNYSFFNDSVNVCAPGTAVSVLIPGNSSSSSEGTSFSSPIVAGMAAMLKQSYPSAGRGEFLTLLEQTSDLESHTEEAEYQYKYGCGVVNISRYCAKLLGHCALSLRSGEAAAVFPAETEAPWWFDSETGIAALPDPVRSGYSFRGWYDSADCLGDPVTAVPAGTDADVILYARWEADADADLSAVLASAERRESGIEVTLSARDDNEWNSYSVIASAYDEEGRWLGFTTQNVVFRTAGADSEFSLLLPACGEASEVRILFLSADWQKPRQDMVTCSVKAQNTGSAGELPEIPFE